LLFFVLAVILSAAKDPEEVHTTPTVSPFLPKKSPHQWSHKMPEGHVYILGSTTGTLYTGVTSDFDLRIFQHRNGIKSGFASKYHCNRLLLHERFVDIRSAIAREKEIKGWTRTKKLTLIAQLNPEFKDLGVHLGWQMLHPQQNIADQK
jgi:putative endonuclease